MYGMNVHNSVFESDDDKSGMTIHKVTEDYDEGDVVFQVQVDISQCESAEEIASKVLALEHHYYPRIATEIMKSTMVLFAVIDIVGSIPVLMDVKSKAGNIHPGRATFVALGIMLAFLKICNISLECLRDSFKPCCNSISS